ILITGYADITTPEALNRGAEAVVNKPFDLDELFVLCDRLVKPLTERWMKEFKSESIQQIPEGNLSYGRGGFFVKGSPQPKAGALFKIVIDGGSKTPKTYEVVCRWGRPEKKDMPEGWGAEIQAWDTATEKQGWEHQQKVPFIPIK